MYADSLFLIWWQKSPSRFFIIFFVRYVLSFTEFDVANIVHNAQHDNEYLKTMVWYYTHSRKFESKT